MSTPINLDVLKSYKTDLYNAVVESLSIGPITGIIQVSKLQWWAFPENVRSQLVAVLRAKAPTEHDATCGCNDCFNKRTAEHAQRENERLKIEAVVKAADARIMEYVSQGLVNTVANREIFMKFLDEKFPGLKVITQQHVDAIVAAKRNELQWKAPEPATPPVQEPPRTLPTGEPELPLNVSEAEKQRASVAQLRDWFKRSNGQQLLRSQQYGGSSRSSWFAADSQVR